MLVTWEGEKQFDYFDKCVCGLKDNEVYKEIFNKNIRIIMINARKDINERIKSLKEKLEASFFEIDFENYEVKLFEYFVTIFEAKKNQMTKSIIWHDPKIYTETLNTEFYKDFLYNFDVQRFEDHIEANKYIQNSLQDFLIITSGKNGQAFTKLIHNNRNVLGISVFCNSEEIHRKWASGYDKIQMVSKAPLEINKELMRMYNSHCAYYSLSDRSYVEVQTHVSQEFWRIIFDYLLVLRNNKEFGPNLFLNEMINLNVQYKEKIEELFNSRKTELLKAILNVYSSNYIYNHLNIALGNRHYDNLQNTLTYVAQELLSNNKYPNLFHTEGAVLYRGIRHGIDVFNEFNEYRIKKTRPLFFPSFSSASSIIDIAKIFAGVDGVILKIILSKKNPYPHIMLPDGWSLYANNEVETLIYSYFPFYVDKIEDLDEQYKIITLIQDENCPVFSRDQLEMKKFWNKTIAKAIENEKDVKVLEVENVVDSILENINLETYDDKKLFDTLTSGSN